MIGIKRMIGVKGVTGGIAGRRGPITPPASIFERPRTGPAIRFQWGSNRRRTSSRYGHGHLVKPRPWYLTWLVSREPPGFQWGSGRD